MYSWCLQPRLEDFLQHIMEYMYIYTVSQKSSHLYTLCNFVKCWPISNFCTVGKRMKFATKPVRHYPHHLRHVAALPWKIKSANFLQIFSTYERKCKQIAFLSPLPLLIIHKFWYFQCLNSEFSPYWSQIKFSMSLFFYSFTFAINVWHRKFITADVPCSVCQQSTWYSATRTRVW